MCSLFIFAQGASSCARAWFGAVCSRYCRPTRTFRVRFRKNSYVPGYELSYCDFLCTMPSRKSCVPGYRVTSCPTVWPFGERLHSHSFLKRRKDLDLLDLFLKKGATCWAIFLSRRRTLSITKRWTTGFLVKQATNTSQVYFTVECTSFESSKMFALNRAAAAASARSPIGARSLATMMNGTCKIQAEVLADWLQPITPDPSMYS